MSKRLSAKQAKAILVLAKKDYTVATVKKRSKISADELEELVNLKILEKFKNPGGRSFYLRISNIGKEEYEDIIQATAKVPKKKVKSPSINVMKSIVEESTAKLPKKKAKSPSTDVMKSIIEESLSPYREMIGKIDLKLDQIITHLKLSPPSTIEKTVAVTLQKFQEELKEHWTELDRIYRWGGRVEIPMLRRRMGQISEKDFNQYILELEKQRVVDLQIASDPSVVNFPEKGIQHPGRGLIYYIIWRK